MLKELSWYIESNRFTDIINSIEEKADAYSKALEEKSENTEKLREDLRNFCQWHMEKSGYRNEEVPYINIDIEFFNGSEINREALNTFEKEIIKAHMYQKHLWEFMGTTGSMTVISKTAMKRDGFNYDNYLPIEYKKAHKPKSPISNILSENPNAVPFYMYLDGTVSNEYNPEKSKARFDVLKDKSGFDWTKKGWDPNYEVKKDDWHGEFDKSGNWIMVKENEASSENITYKGARFEKIPEIEIIKDGKQAIIYDPQYSLLSTFERIYILTNGDIYGAETEDTEETVKLIQKSMKEMGVTSIKAICGGNTEKSDSKIPEEKVISFYKKLFGKNISKQVKIKTINEYKTIKQEIIQKTITEKEIQIGKNFAKKIEVAALSGAAGNEVVRAIETEKIKVPLSVFNEQDKKTTGLTDEEFNVIQNYTVPDDKKELFSRAIINLILERKTIETSGKKITEIFDTVYSNVVQNKKTKEVISIETTFSELCNNPEKILGNEKVEEITLKKLEQAKKELPEQETPELQTKVNNAVDNVIRNFAAIRMSTGMTPEEAVKLAVKTVGGKDSNVFIPPVSGIVYKTPGQNSSGINNNVNAEKDKRIFSDISVAELINNAKTKLPVTKDVDIEKVFKSLNKMESKEYHNLFNDAERKEWYKTNSFKKTGLTKEAVEKLINFEQAKIQEQSIQIQKTLTYSKKKELDKEFGYRASEVDSEVELENRKCSVIAKVEAVTKSKNASELVREKKSDQNYKVASVTANGRITREFAGALNARNFVSERQRVVYGKHINFSNFTDEDKTYSNIHNIVQKQLEKNYEIKDIEKKVTSGKNRFNVFDQKDASRAEVVGYEKYNAENAGSFSSDKYNNVIAGERNVVKTGNTDSEENGKNNGVSQSKKTAITEISTSSETKTDSLSSKKVLTPQEKEAARIAKMNANYEHDKRVLAKNDPLFAKNQFWDVEHAEETEDRKKQMKKAERNIVNDYQEKF